MPGTSCALRTRWMSSVADRASRSRLRSPCSPGESDQSGSQQYKGRWFWDRVALQLECHVERWVCGRADDVRSNPQPVRIEIAIPDPRLQVGINWRVRGSGRNRPQRRQPEEISTRQSDLRDEKVVVRRKTDRVREHHIESYFLSRYRSLAHRVLIRTRKNPIQNRVLRRERVRNKGHGN